ncbi:hypothetical protein BJ912DRAFT_976520 [Pholiota molesta]|nr:hypothetical protein BJ912DRAFT_976520 [Pholiota molesta]
MAVTGHRRTLHRILTHTGYWFMPAPPPLYKAPMREKPHRRTPRYVFGWAFTHEDQVELADKLDIPKDDEHPEVIRISCAWTKLRGMLPKNVRRVAAVQCIRDGEKTFASCIYIGSNLSKEEIIRAQKEKFIGQVWDLLDTDINPDWHVRIS